MTSNKVLYMIDIALCFIEVGEPVYCFFKKGRRGINIDVMPGNMKLLRKIRPRDINLEIAIFNKQRLSAIN